MPDGGLLFDRGRTEIQKMLGNAVPSLLAEVLAREIRHQLLDHEQNLGTLKLTPPMKSLPPDPDPVAPVPSRYLDLIGDHLDHPGEGRLSGRRKKTGPKVDHIPLVHLPTE